VVERRLPGSGGKQWVHHTDQGMYPFRRLVPADFMMGLGCKRCLKSANRAVSSSMGGEPGPSPKERELMKTSTSGELRAEIACYCCNRAGHFAADCPYVMLP
jgi:hypothetical protein